MASLKAIAKCIKLKNPNNFRVVRDFYGYTTGAPSQLSLLTQVHRLQGKHIHLNVIRVGIESFDNDDEREIDRAIEITRDLFAPAKLGIGRIERYFITTADANGRENINSDGEAKTLTDEWTVDNDALDVFFVLTYATSTVGYSRIDGPCNKDAKGMDGSVVAIEGSVKTTGYALAHEIGHYLGLKHKEEDNTNLMYPSVPNGGNLTSSQGSKIRGHCFVDSGCK
jgi:hypothetical protein